MVQLLSTKNTTSWPAVGVLHKQFSKCKLEYLCWLRPFHTGQNCCPTTCIRATVTPNRSLFGKPPGTSLICVYSSTHRLWWQVHIETIISLPDHAEWSHVLFHALQTSLTYSLFFREVLNVWCIIVCDLLLCNFEGDMYSHCTQDMVHPRPSCYNQSATFKPSFWGVNLQHQPWRALST